MYRYEVARRTLANLLDDLRILSGDEVGPSDASWQDVAGSAAANAQALANLLEQARAGHSATPVFPSPDDLES